MNWIFTGDLGVRLVMASTSTMELLACQLWDQVVGGARAHTEVVLALSTIDGDAHSGVMVNIGTTQDTGVDRANITAPWSRAKFGRFHSGCFW